MKYMQSTTSEIKQSMEMDHDNILKQTSPSIGKSAATEVRKISNKYDVNFSSEDQISPR